MKSQSLTPSVAEVQGDNLRPAILFASLWNPVICPGLDQGVLPLDQEI
jgi:hypothetical protein